MKTGINIKKIREQKGLTQAQLADLIHMHRSNYSKVENGQREISVDALKIITRHFGMTMDQIVNFEGEAPDEVTVEDKAIAEQVRMIQNLDMEEKHVVFKMVDTFLTQKRFKEFFHKNIAAL